MSTTLEKETEVKKAYNYSWDRRAFLKIKIKSLAAEAKIIRLEEKKNQQLRVELRAHRLRVVREEARATLLAYAFIRGRAYKTVEASNRQGHKPNWLKVETMVTRYGKAFDPTLNTIENQRVYNAMMDRFKTWVPA